ncbi:MAG: hypothetical protein LBN02_04310 [Oscillospiraceae bacterium]|nr:hypothetical protein [Oscillospiraceae bacterium]
MKNIYDTAFAKQTELDEPNMTYIARCAVCGKSRTIKKKLFCSNDKTLSELRLRFNYCQTCGRWICNDCYLVDDGNGNAMAICPDCAKERGITGVTNAQFDALWPEIRRRRRERNNARERPRSEHTGGEEPQV